MRQIRANDPIGQGGGWAREPSGAIPPALVLATATGCRLETAEAPVPAQALAPELSLLAHDGRTVTLDQLLARGPAVLVFYRGHW